MLQYLQLFKFSNLTKVINGTRKLTRGNHNMEDKKRKQHYVFQSYLSAWTINDKLWCVRIGGAPFNTSTLNIAQERDFYRLRPLNDNEKRLYNLLLLKTQTDTKKAFLDHIDHYLLPLEMLKKTRLIRQSLETQFGGYDKIPVEIKAELLNLEKVADINVNNTEEDYYSIIEGESVKWLDSLKKEISNFYYTVDTKITENREFNDEKFNFLFFLCTQYYRTKAAKERWISIVKPILDDPRWSAFNISKEDIDLENLVHHVFWFFINTCAYALRKMDSHLTILVNDTGTPFITSDQPVINLKANYQNLNEETNDLVFYYPISPNIAITVNDDNNNDKIMLNEQQVDVYNWAIVKSSYQNIFADRKDIFERYK